jgi:predicted transcriptional regulator
VNNASRFLDAFTKIEKLLKKYVDREEKYSFSLLIKKAKRVNKMIETLEYDLKEIADLRNAIVHERTDGHPIAEPYDETVTLVENICKALENPPRARIFQKKVSTVKPNDNVEKLLKIINDNSYSQIPIYEGKRYFGVITTNAITRWIASLTEDGIAMYGDKKVKDILDFLEESEEVVFVGIDDNLFETLELFSKYSNKGKKLDAVLITQSGKKNESLLGMITLWDIPKILEKIDINSSR